MTLHIETGHPVTADVKQVDGRCVRFVSDDDRTMFEVIAGKDGRSLEVRAVEVTKVDGVIYAGRLVVYPAASNTVTIRVPRYEDGEA